MVGYDLESDGSAAAEGADGYVVNDDLNNGDVSKVMLLGGLFAAGYALTALLDRNPEVSEQEVEEEGFDYSSLKEDGSWEELDSVVDTSGYAELTETTGYLAITEEMEEVAAQLEEDTVLETIVADAEYVKEHIGMNGYYLGIYDVNVPETAAETFQDGTGVCAEHANLFTAIAREQGIPAVIRTGISRGVGHAWAEVPVQTEDGVEYLIVDPTNNYIGPYSENYIHSFDAGHPFSQLSDALAITGNIKDYDSMGKLLLYDHEKLPDIAEALKDPGAHMHEISEAIAQARIEVPPEELEAMELAAEYGHYIRNGVRFGGLGLVSYGFSSLGNKRKMSIGGALKSVALGIVGGTVATASSLIFGLGQYMGIAGNIGAIYGGSNTEKTTSELEAEQAASCLASEEHLFREEE